MNTLQQPLVIISEDTEDYFQELMSSSLRCFYNELQKMIQDNDAHDFHSWFTERSYMSLFFNGIVRSDKANTKSVIQEYSVVDKESEETGRCDGMLTEGKKVVLFEAKYFRHYGQVDENHFNIDDWVKWDETLIRKQLQWYYEKDRHFFLERRRIECCYLSTIVFKIIKEKPEQFIQLANDKLKPELKNCLDRQWFYSAAFLGNDSTDEQIYGIEVYGTVNKTPESVKSITAGMEQEACK